MDTYYYCKMALNENEAEDNLRLYNIHQFFSAADEECMYGGHNNNVEN